MEPSRASDDPGAPRGPAGPVFLPELQPLLERLADDVTWPKGVRLEGGRLNRFWPGRRGRRTFELALSLRTNDAAAIRFLQGGRIGSVRIGAVGAAAVLAPAWLRNLSVAHADLGLAVTSPDCDPRLPALRAALRPGGLRELLRGTAAGFLPMPAPEGESLRAELVAYRINRRGVIRLRGPAGGATIFMKAYRRMPPAEEIERYRQVRAALEAGSGGHLRMPEILQVLPDRGCLFLAAAPGDCRAPGRTPDDLSAAAAALSVLHALRVDPGRLHTPRDELRIASRWLGVLKAAAPDLHAEMRAILLELARRAKNLSAEGLGIVHRDFYAAQILRQARTVWLVDFDTLGRAHPEVDVATFVAHLLLDEIAAGQSDESARVSAAHFIDAYREHGGELSPDRLRFYLASALTRLGAIHLSRGLPPAQVRRLWGFAGAPLDRGPRAR